MQYVAHGLKLTNDKKIMIILSFEQIPTVLQFLQFYDIRNLKQFCCFEKFESLTGVRKIGAAQMVVELFGFEH